MYKPYKPFDTKQPIEKLHDFIKEIVYLWIDADLPFSTSMITNKELLKFLEETKVSNEFWIETVENIYEHFRAENLTPAQRQELKDGFEANNNIDGLCDGSCHKAPMRYSELPLPDELKKTGKSKGLLQKFFEDAYNKVLKRKPFYEIAETRKTYFDKLMSSNRLIYCPFCGLEKLKSKHVKNKTDDFDHYFTKSIYPFSSVNFYNLPPMCKTCNRDEKKAKDPLHDKSKNRRKAFKPFGTAKNYGIKVSFNFKNKNYDLKDLQMADVEIHLSSPNYTDEVKTWDSLFRIKGRYKEQICNEADIWIEELLELYELRLSDGVCDDLDTFIDRRLQEYALRKWENANYLRFLFFSHLKNTGTLAMAFQDT